MIATSLADILQLSIPERIQLVEDIWDSIAVTPEQLVLSEVQRQELDHRLEAYRKNPEAGVPWDQVKERIKKLV